MKTTLAELCPDIWQQIFEYFDPIELFYSLVHVAIAADEVLFAKAHHLRLQRLVIDPYVKILPKELPLDRIVSLELRQDFYLDITEECLNVRSLKLRGQPTWVVSMLRKVSSTSIKLDELVLIVPGIRYLYVLLECATSLLSLHRLSIHANEWEEKILKRSLSARPSKIEYFRLDTCSPMTWVELSCMLSILFNVRSLDITLLGDSKDSYFCFTFPKLCYICLRLIEISFETVIQIVKATPSLTKLKLNGFVQTDGFVINHNWLKLFEYCFSLNTIIVNLSLEKGTDYFCIHTSQTSLREINLRLTCIEDDYDYYSDGRNQQRWWALSGIINK
ncbi:unnamed protein product [Adineta ricciae]|uniref:Uncharacterized protein n=1 Tax=Adineta ricciae TaxID=249248 RepID=A0A815EVK4_ADIRI|nr:unnamed protein product [Adineta ricciae]CAF1311346.1 unnamed protein product [Adineta ricciae]